MNGDDVAQTVHTLSYQAVHSQSIGKRDEYLRRIAALLERAGYSS